MKNHHHHVLIVSEDRAHRRGLVHGLVACGAFRPWEAADGREALLMAGSGTSRFDAIIIETTLADGVAAELCAQLRRYGVRVPIILLDARASEADAVRALDGGASDVVRNRRWTAELEARLRAHIRQHQSSEHARLAIGPYLFSPGKRTLVERGTERRLRLTPMETGILKCLHRAGGATVSRAVLLHEVWNYNSGVQSHTVETHVYRLRRKIEINGGAPSIIENTRGGYRLGDGEWWAAATV
jgi:DNA-binding response OmpR family regulator